MRERRSLKHGTQSRDGHTQSAPSPQQRSEPGLIPRPRGSRRAARDAAGSAPWGRDHSRGRREGCQTLPRVCETAGRGARGSEAQASAGVTGSVAA